MKQDQGSLEDPPSGSSKSRGWILDIIEQHERSLMRYALHFIHDHETARDIVQDTFLQLCRQKDDQVRSKLPAWLFTACRNRAIDVGRKEKRMKTSTDELPTDKLDPSPSPAAVAESKDAFETVLNQVVQLPEREQELLQLKFEAGLSYQQMADVTGLSRTNVGFLLHKAVSTLRERTSSREGA